MTSRSSAPPAVFRGSTPPPPQVGLAGRHIGFIGGGNMAEALIRGLLESGGLAENIQASDPAPLRRQHLEASYGIAVSASNAAVAGWADLVVLAVKPDVMYAALEAIRGHLAQDLVLSIAAGVPIDAIEAGLEPGSRVIRAMPNTAAMSLAGATAVAPGHYATEADMGAAIELFDAVGRTVVVPEYMLDAVTGLSGSGPAYVMLFIEALADGGVRAGLPRDVSLLLAAQTVYGAAKLQLESNEHPALLRDRVTSPGGTTIAGLSKLESGAVRGAIIEAVAAAAERSAELGRGH